MKTYVDKLLEELTKAKQKLENHEIVTGEDCFIFNALNQDMEHRYTQLVDAMNNKNTNKKGEKQ